MNAVTLVAITIVMTAGSLLLAFMGEGDHRALGWIGVVFFGVGCVGIAIRGVRERDERRAAALVDADVEIASAAASSGTSNDVAGRVVEAHYAYLERHPRDRILDVRVERAWIARESGLDEDTVRRVLEAHDEFLIASGLMSPLRATGSA
jgi:hypothetical protein